MMGMLTRLQRALAALRSGKIAEATPEESDEPMRVLVVDDDQNVLRTAERALRDAGYLPISTTAPQAALQMARSMAPGAIFLDVLMPGFDGWDVLAALKADPATSDIPVFMICMLGERAEALASGAAGVVSKPLDADKIMAALASVQSIRAGAALVAS